jgi:hypothetical protein
MVLVMWLTFRLSWKLQLAVQSLFTRLFWFAIWLNVGRFPFGLFGITSFILFVLITCNKILNLYVVAVSS